MEQSAGCRWARGVAGKLGGVVENGTFGSVIAAAWAKPSASRSQQVLGTESSGDPRTEVGTMSAIFATRSRPEPHARHCRSECSEPWSPAPECLPRERPSQPVQCSRGPHEGTLGVLDESGVLDAHVLDGYVESIAEVATPLFWAATSPSSVLRATTR